MGDFSRVCHAALTRARENIYRACCMPQGFAVVAAAATAVALTYLWSRAWNWIDALNLLGEAMATEQMIRGRDGKLLPGRRIAAMLTLTRTAGRREREYMLLVPVVFALGWWALAWYWGIGLLLGALFVGKRLRNVVSPPVRNMYYVETLIAELPGASARAIKGRAPRDSEALLTAREWLLALQMSRGGQSTWADL